MAGLAHLVLSMFPTMTWYDLKSRIEDTAWDLNGSTGFPGYDQYIGWGRVDAERATRFESRNVSVSVRPGVYQLVSIGMWPGGLPGGTKAQDWGALFGPALTDPSGPHGFRAYWWDTESRAYVDYTDYRAPRVGAGRSYWVRFNPGFDGSGNPLPPAPSAYTITNTLGGAYPFMQAGHPVVTHLLPRTPDPAGGTHTLIGTPGQDPVAWNRQTIKVLVPQPDGTGQIMTLQQAKNLNFVEQYATRWNAQTQGYEIVAEPGTPNLPPGYPVVSSMQPGEGYFLHSNVECLLLLPKN